MTLASGKQRCHVAAIPQGAVQPTCCQAQPRNVRDIDLLVPIEQLTGGISETRVIEIRIQSTLEEPVNERACEPIVPWGVRRSAGGHLRVERVDTIGGLYPAAGCGEWWRNPLNRPCTFCGSLRPSGFIDRPADSECKASLFCPPQDFWLGARGGRCEGVAEGRRQQPRETPRRCLQLALLINFACQIEPITRARHGDIEEPPKLLDFPQLLEPR